MKRLSTYFVLAALLSSCGQLNKGIDSIPVATPMDGVKLLSPSITKADDPGAMTQASYAIGTSSRLLMRLENFLCKVDEVSIGTTNLVTVKITLNSASDAARAQASLQVCPILKNWMMLATWARAYPMAGDGRWSQAGGDYDSDACIAVKAITGKEISFDSTPWFLNYVRGRRINYGLILISSDPSAIVI